MGVPSIWVTQALGCTRLDVVAAGLCFNPIMVDTPREQVFISSTFTDLVEERQAVTRALLQAKAFPAGMELFPASDSSSWGVIERAIDDSDYYLLIVAGRYGSIDPERQVSFTEREYDYAVKAGKPIMAFIHGDVDNLVVARTDRDSERASQLEEFRARVMGRHQVASWTSAGELAGQVVLALNELRQTDPAVGWVRGDQAMTEPQRAALELLTADLATSTARVQELEALVLPSDLAQGEDTYELKGTVLMSWPGDGVTHLSRERWTMAATWDSILRRLAPLLLQTASTYGLRDKLGEWSNGARYLDYDPADGDPPELSKLEGWEIDESSLYEVLFQLDALGLIETDNGDWWGLTPRGRSQLRASAIKRPVLS